MNRAQLSFLLAIALATVIFIALGSYILIATQSADPISAEAAARSCLTELVGNCIIK